MKNQTFSYKGYIGTIEFSLEDRILFGSVKGINDLLVYEGKDLDELENSFHQIIDEYLEMCAEIGKDPDKTLTGSFNVRIGEDLHKQLSIEAIQNGISQNECLKHILDNHYNHNKIKELEEVVNKIAKYKTYSIRETYIEEDCYFSHPHITRLGKEAILNVQ